MLVFSDRPNCTVGHGTTAFTLAVLYRRHLFTCLCFYSVLFRLYQVKILNARLHIVWHVRIINERREAAMLIQWGARLSCSLQVRAWGAKSNSLRSVLIEMLQTAVLENVAIANALQLETAWRHATPFPASIMTPWQVWSRWTYPLRYYSVLLLIHYFTLWPWHLRFDTEHLQCIACDVMKLCTKFERNRTIRGKVIAISIFDLMTLNVM